MGELKNCPSCGNLFVQALRAVCPACHRAEEERFQKVYTYVRKSKHRQSTILEVTEATGVSEENIFRYIREGRLNLAHLPNFSYPCEGCGEPIREHRLCRTCSGRISSGLEAEEKQREWEARQVKDKRSTYRAWE
ncbi:TIGR03826 family flagellar region protein [Marinococcus luteus]|uniref:TIGR03826 family flagellar region protein n=1 Tax=Marinococcus luteus TaxID=1122204 RepID=UPI002ACD1778|nr:TIGR03826 family flagellar region protein [Marinococcus luteus]MDZ5784084.1 TIGR03826 family flagellar region protein [Marinococcus luteus]